LKDIYYYLKVKNRTVISENMIFFIKSFHLYFNMKIDYTYYIFQLENLIIHF
jgi:hypothetical protein